MPPQPNCPSNGVFAFASEQHKKRSVVLHYWLTQFLTKLCSNASHIRYTTPFVSQHQTTVKFYGVFTSHWRSLVFTPEQGVQRIAARDSGDLVTPFMHVTIQMTRHFAHICYFPIWLYGTNHHSMADLTFLQVSLHRCKVRTVSYNLLRKV